MKIMTFNTQHCLNYKERYIVVDLMARTLLDQDADIVGLNEMRGAGEHPEYTDQTGTLSALTGLTHWFFAPAIHVKGGGPYGNGLLSKLPILHAEIIPIPCPEVRRGTGYYEPRCLLKAKLEGEITVLVCHFGLNDDEAERAVETVLAHASETRCILMGDFNLTPDSSILDPIRAKMKDTAAYFEEPQLSFPSDAPTRKIDYLFVSPDVEVISAEIPPIVASDHRPYTATVNL
jgi:endonuclease/exonuclease/phosphatase family metal-dependent hydrolase